MRRTHRPPPTNVIRQTCLCFALVLASLALITGFPPKQRASTYGFGDGSERVSIASADARGYVGTARSHHARTARSLPADVNSSSVDLVRLINSNHKLSNHSVLTFLRYPASHSDVNASATTKVHGDSDAFRSGAMVTNQYLPAESFNVFISPVPQAGSSKIVFATNRDGSMQIYVMNGDGTGVTRITDSGANDDFPRWSPNGTKILFQSDRDHADTGYMDIYVMNSDGGGVTRLTTDPNDDSIASW